MLPFFRAVLAGTIAAFGLAAAMDATLTLWHVLFAPTVVGVLYAAYDVRRRVKQPEGWTDTAGLGIAVVSIAAVSIIV